MFLGRRSEQELLERKYEGGNFEFAVIYGRRRVGKTALIEKFCEGKKAVFFTARRTNQRTNLKILDSTVRKVLGEEEQEKRNGENTSPEDPDADRIFGRIAEAAGSERIVLVIDEFPNLAETDPGISDSLQVFIDHYFRKTKLFLILCGSSMSFMEEQILGAKSPLYGRCTIRLKIRPMDYYESALFFPERSPSEKAEIYGAVGGIPMYLTMFSDMTSSVPHLISENFLQTGSVLSYEPENLLMQEMKDPKKYTAVIEAVAEGRARISEISSKTGISPVDVTRAIDDLIALDYVVKVTPINEPGTRKTRYFLKDNLFRFYYSNIFGKEDLLKGRTEEETERNISSILPHYTGKIFEDMAAGYIRRFLGYGDIGKWWGTSKNSRTSEEIDIVARRKTLSGKTEGLFAECKFRNEPMTIDVLFRLEDRAADVRGFDSKEFALFSKSGFSDELKDQAEREGVVLVELKDMYMNRTE
ncbi:ATP-binding protein [Methanosarcinaceae archaeon]|nr:ATP-binding protein [Methanosarcinaceae archaeon]